MKKIFDYIWYGNEEFSGLQYLWFGIEIGFSNIQQFFGYDKDTSKIAEGVYCNTHDIERNKKEPSTNGSIWIKTCPYYRWTKRTKGIACTYVGFMGFDFGLYDQCKICGENRGIDDE